MKISILSSNLSGNCLGRAHVLAELLERYFEVEVLGPKLSGDVWNPISNKRNYKILSIKEDIPKFFWDINGSINKIKGDVVISVKPKGTSFGVAIAKKIKDNTPIILDIDDWEASKMYGTGIFGMNFIKNIPSMYYINSPTWSFILEQHEYFLDGKTVSNRFLQSKFGGSIVPHARDTEKFGPELFDQSSTRAELGLPEGTTIVMFSGTPRPHKGVDDLIRAMNSLEASEIVAIIVGMHDSRYVNELKRLAGERVTFYGQQPFDDIPKWVAAADIIVIPQKRTLANRGQIPAKVFDAMAMAKPVIATPMSDLPEVLDGCGIIVDPDSPRAIANAIEDLHVNPEKGKALGRAARRRCVERYSYKALAPKMKDIALSAVNR
jgi:glycosyltransferase involved in cell wall biosynthesis